MKVYILKEQTTGICSAYNMIEVFTSIDDIKFWLKIHPVWLMAVARNDVLIDNIDTISDINKILRPATFILEWDTYKRGDDE